MRNMAFQEYYLATICSTAEVNKSELIVTRENAVLSSLSIIANWHIWYILNMNMTVSIEITLYAQGNRGCRQPYNHMITFA